MPVIWGCYTALEIISLVNLLTIRSFPDSEWFKVNVGLLPAAPTQLQLKDGVSLPQSLGILSPERSIQGHNSSIFLGIHPFAKGLGIIFSRFVRSIHKKSVCLTHHSCTSIKLMALSRKNRYIDYKQREKLQHH